MGTAKAEIVSASNGSEQEGRQSRRWFYFWVLLLPKQFSVGLGLVRQTSNYSTVY